jgi:NAD(P)-dependent dehydrogenase (short-subunit alcohol dehydrogenase family)
MLFDQKVAIVTGASSGIGRATALAFGREGAAVVAVGRDDTALEAVVREIQSAGAYACSVVVDVALPEAPDRIVHETVDRFGGIDTLVNAAGIIGSGSIDTTTDAMWDTMLDINARAPFRLTRAAVPHLVARRGTVVNVSSVTGLRSFPGILSYAVSKAAVDQLTRCTALELASRGVRVNAVNPGVVVTNLHRRSGMAEDRYAAFLDRSRETHPLGRPGEAHEIAELILFLASSRSGWITGETISVDGGRHLTCAR